jgi:hypothetical protein
MSLKRMTKAKVMTSALGSFKPVGHMVLAFESDAAAVLAAQAMWEDGFEFEDILQYSAAEEAELMGQLLNGASAVAGFGYEVALMKRYRELAEQGCGWLVVYTPDQERADRVTALARQHQARMAERYGHWMIEDVI